LDKGQYFYNYLYLRSYFNNLDRKFFARQGNQLLFNATMKHGRDYYFEFSDNTDSVSKPNSKLWQISLNSEFRQSLHDRLTIRESLDLGYLANSSGFITDDFMFGGTKKFAVNHVPFVGLNEGQIRTNSHVAAGVGLQYRAMGELYGLANVQSLLYDFENPFHQNDWDNNKFMIGFGGGIGYNLSALPIQLMMMYSPQIGKVYTNVAIGFMF
jgi:NTE family protein